MQKIKILLASRPKMLSDVMRNMVERQPDMEVVGEVLDPIELMLEVKAAKVDTVIVTPLESEREPRICRLLLEEHPHLIIVTLPAKGETAYLYRSGRARMRVDEPSEQSILGAVRESLKSITG